MMRVTHNRAALLLQVETYDLEGIDYFKLIVVWQEDRNTIHEMHLDSNSVYANPTAGDRIEISFLMDTPLRVKPLDETAAPGVSGSESNAQA